MYTAKNAMGSDAVQALDVKTLPAVSQCFPACVAAGSRGRRTPFPARRHELLAKQQARKSALH